MIGFRGFLNYARFAIHDSLITRFPSEDSDADSDVEEDAGLTSGATSSIDPVSVITGCSCSSINSAALAPVVLIGCCVCCCCCN